MDCWESIKSLLIGVVVIFVFFIVVGCEVDIILVGEIVVENLFFYEGIWIFEELWCDVWLYVNVFFFSESEWKILDCLADIILFVDE